MRKHDNFIGLTAALATPLTVDGKFDKAGMEKLVNYTIESGVSNLLTLGVAGEASTFDLDTRNLIIGTVKQAAKNRVPVVAGVIDSSTDLVLRNIHHAKELGADFVMATPPNFYVLTQAEMKSFFMEIADKGGVPVIAYNCSWVRNQLAPETVAELAAHPNMAALKETSNMVTLQNMKDVLRDREDFVLISGEEYLFLPAISIGIEAFIMGGPGNILPKLCIETIEDYKNGRMDAAAKKHNNMFAFLSRLYNIGLLDMAAVKAVLEISNICSRYVSRPFRNPTDEEVSVIAGLMKQYNIKL
jgi:4-hydroxy-tetrahydrodipicolinate synthase